MHKKSWIALTQKYYEKYPLEFTRINKLLLLSPYVRHLQYL